jgi:hypothetical protein
MPSIILVLVLREFIYSIQEVVYNAFDAACPNQVISSCSTMTLKGLMYFVLATVMNIVCLQGGSEYPLKQYRVEVNGNVLRIYINTKARKAKLSGFS